MIYRRPIATQYKMLFQSKLKTYKSYNQGFSLLEAIVAMVLISLTGMAVFQWLNQSLANLTVLERQQSSTLITQNALAYIKTVNPMQTPKGSVQLGNTQLEWTSELLEPITTGVTQKSTLTHYSFGLYLLQVNVIQNNHPPYQFSVRQVGYKG